MGILLDFWFKPINYFSFKLFRIAFAFVFILYLCKHLFSIEEWFTETGFHINSNTKNWYHTDPFPLLSSNLAYALFFSLILSSVFLIFNKYSKVNSFILLIGNIYIQNVDPFNSFTLNKIFIITFLVIFLSPYPSNFFLKNKRVSIMSIWPIRILQINLVLIYFTSGLCKVLNGDWLIYSDIIWAQNQGINRTAISAFMLRNLPISYWRIMTFVVLGFELFSPILLFSKKIKPYYLIFGILFHISIALMMYQLFFFSIQMISFYIVFLNNDSISKLSDKLNLKKII